MVVKKLSHECTYSKCFCTLTYSYQSPYAAMPQLSGLAEVMVDSGKKATLHQRATFGNE